MKYRPLLRPAVAVLVAVAATACQGGEAAERAPGPDARLHALLSGADSSFVVPLKVGDTLTTSAGTVAFYERLRYRPVWTEGGELTQAGARVLTALDSAVLDGLDPASYGMDAIRRILAALEREGDAELDDASRAEYLADLDLTLSEGYLRYTTDLVRGIVDPDEVGRAWRIPRPDAPGEAILRSAYRGDAVQIAQRLRPRMPNYARLMSGLARMREIRERGGWPQVPELNVEQGDSAPGVAVLRQRMLASEDPREAGLARSGSATPWVYDRDLRDAVRHFQGRHGLDDDGHVGAATLRELNHTPDDRIAELRLNLDRWRWLPSDLGEFFVLVNIAGFELDVVENGRVIESMNVVVGQPGWSTPVFADTIEHVVVNPYWTPTENILREEIYPAMEQDPGYLERNGFIRTSEGTIRQKPGGQNALGRYKFMFPNDEDIYLHDTPADHLFSRARRDFSHGCIRLERPADLARLLVSRRASQHEAASLERLVRTESEQWIRLKRPVPIYLVYFTAWVTDDGTIRFHHDVYGHDEELVEETADAEA